MLNFVNVLIALSFSWLYIWVALILVQTGNPPLQAAGYLGLLVLAVGVLKEVKV
ncbi:hypothetical protein [Ktedonobacter robiniae]|uniref:Uncharacterized protein n=1 Tax=Ktedonobacter robiniae TaxID=2778365 RepID=A0ABQ3USW7_9CHLR|nr:hypothetical protein [Ktedonobacter robiniae]GHO55480.1 hypothetical protein KSB_39550 [Ktedonobacter robiniae]